MVQLPANRLVKSLVGQFTNWAKYVVGSNFLRNDYYEMVALPLLLLESSQMALNSQSVHLVASVLPDGCKDLFAL